MRASRPKIVGIVNVTRDSFSDGGRYLQASDAVAHAERLLADGADVIELGPASSHPEAEEIDAEEEIRRLAPVLDALAPRGTTVSIDSWQPGTQRYALRRDVVFLNDIEGFRNRELYAELAAGACKLIVMHSIQRRGKATREATDARAVLDGIRTFFDERITTLEGAGVARDRLILDPGMGLFLGSNPEPSLLVLRSLGQLRETFGLPLLISVSRKSFLRSITGRRLAERGPATLAAEIFAVGQGVDYVRTHDVAALADALAVLTALDAV